MDILWITLGILCVTPHVNHIDMIIDWDGASPVHSRFADAVFWGAVVILIICYSCVPLPPPGARRR